MKWIVLGAIVAIGGIVAWMVLSKDRLPPGFASGNGRLEATDIYVATRYQGRVKEVLVREGDTVEAGQVLARMDIEDLDAKIRAAEARVVEAQARIGVAQADRQHAVAQVAVKQADYAYADKTYSRSQNLVKGGAVSEQEADIDLSRKAMAQAELVGARAQVAQAQASIDAAKADVIAGQAEIESLQAEKKDSILVAPIRARVETRLAEPGEVLPAGGRVYSLLDLSDVYMYIFLPASEAGKVALGSEARIVLDAAPDFPIRTTVSFVSPEAQFTPKTVETAEERYALSFRVKLQLDRERLKEFEPFVKAGVPGMGYVRFDNNANWPESLQPKAASPGQLWSPTGTQGN